MSTLVEGNHITLAAGADLSAAAWKIAKLDASGNAILAAAATDKIVGVLAEVPQKSTGSCDIAHVSGAGTGKVLVGVAGVTVGDYLTSDASGLAVATTNAGDSVFGRAMKTGVSGDVIQYEKMYFRY